MTLDDYFQELKSTLTSPIYFNRLAKLCFEKLFSQYFDFFLYSCQTCFNCCQSFDSSETLSIIEKANEKNSPDPEKKQKKKDKKEREKQKNIQQQSLMTVFTNKESLVEKIKKEKNFFVDKANEKYINIVGKSGIEKMDKALKIFIDLFKIPRGELDTTFSAVWESFQNKGIFMIEAVLFIREDVDAEFKKEILRKVSDFLNKLQHK